MAPSLAALVFAGGICGLFWLNRDNSVRTSKVLWLPVIWLLINGSRPVSSWFGMSFEATGQAQVGNPIDQLVAGLLICVAGIVVARRRTAALTVLRGSWPIAVYFLFCLLSLLFSDFPDWGFKRWFRSLGDLLMVLVIVTESQPVAALQRFFSRSSFVLFPASVLLIKYYPNLSRYYSPEGLQLIGGVTTNKNTLGVTTYVLGLGALWHILILLRDKRQPNRNRRLIAQCITLLLGIQLLISARSATSEACFAFGVGLMSITALPGVRRRSGIVHAVILVMALVGGAAKVLGVQGEIMKGMGRNSDFTGRTPIWAVLSDMNPNPVVGAGFETFWVGPRLEHMNQLFPGINESHNGYLETWLNLGGLGVAVIVLVLTQTYLMAVSTFRRDASMGSLLIAYAVTEVLYNVTEAGFRMLCPAWLFLVLASLTAALFSNRAMPRLQARQELSSGPTGWATPVSSEPSLWWSR